MPNNVKVLLVDDNPMVLGMLRGALAPLAAGHDRHRCGRCTAQGRRRSAGLLVSDYRMPGMDGRQLVEKSAKPSSDCRTCR